MCFSQQVGRDPLLGRQNLCYSSKIVNFRLLNCELFCFVGRLLTNVRTTGLSDQNVAADIRDTVERLGWAVVEVAAVRDSFLNSDYCDFDK